MCVCVFICYACVCVYSPIVCVCNFAVCILGSVFIAIISTDLSHKHLFDYFYTAPNLFKIIGLFETSLSVHNNSSVLSESGLSVDHKTVVLILYHLGDFSYFFSCSFALLHNFPVAIYVEFLFLPTLF